MRASVLRTRPIEGLPPALSAPECSLTRRLDGGYNLAISGKAKLEVTPQGLRYAREFMPMFIEADQGRGVRHWPFLLPRP